MEPVTIDQVVTKIEARQIDALLKAQRARRELTLNVAESISKTILNAYKEEDAPGCFIEYVLQYVKSEKETEDLPEDYPMDLYAQVLEDGAAVIAYYHELPVSEPYLNISDFVCNTIVLIQKQSLAMNLALDEQNASTEPTPVTDEVLSNLNDNAILQ